VLPRQLQTSVAGSLPILTCATFFRRRVIEERGLFFNTSLKIVSDVDWVLRLIKRGVRMAVLRSYTSSYTNSGQNMSLHPKARQETAQIIQSAPWWARAARPAIILHHRFRRWAAGAYRQGPFDYAIYTADSPAARRTFHVAHPTFLWVWSKPVEARLGE